MFDSGRFEFRRLSVLLCTILRDILHDYKFSMNRLLSIIFLVLLSLPAAAQEILARPFLQPGNVSSLAKEQKVVIWHTDSVSANYKLEFAPGATLDGVTNISTPPVSFETLNLMGKTTKLYRVVLDNLNFDTEYTYRVTMGQMVVSTATFTTRTTKPVTRFAVFGDCGTGSPSQAAIAFQVYQQKPQFVMIMGDIAYSFGLVREYRARLFPAFTNPIPSLRRGAPLMQSIPFYMLLGNHDVLSSDLDKYPDGLGFFYFVDLPLNAPVMKHTLEVTGEPNRVKAFKKDTHGRFPKLANYSFDQGNVHVTCLDANDYVDPTDPMLLEWLKSDIGSSKAEWKIVSFHHPGFHTTRTHYSDQRMRVLTPLFEELGVSLVLNGHIHNYQRSMPFTFEPKKNKSGKYVVRDDGSVNGVFHLDKDFDGVTKTEAKGIIYVVSGGGGAGLYDTELSGRPALWENGPKDNWAPFMVKVLSDVHTFTMIETNEKTLVLKQIDDKGAVVDEIKVTR